MIIALVLACGAPGYTAIARPRSEILTVKIKGEAAASLYEGLTAASVVEDCRRRGCIRVGVSLACSTLNLRDPVVCELTLSPDGVLLPPSPALYHSAEDNRNYGASTLNDGVLTVSGEAAAALAMWTGRAVVFDVIDPAAGLLAVR